jgi:glucose/mannose-6-phosphate isomerase
VTELDDRALLARVDPSGMAALIAGLPEQARAAWEAGQAWPLPAGFTTPQRVVLLGMGGSAIGADVAATLAARWGRVPVQVVRGYTPPTLDERTLVIACSYSGETEETLEAFQQALPQAGMRLAVTSGGRLARLAEQLGYALFRFDFPAPPRAAFGWALFPLLAIFQRLGVIALEPATVDAALRELARCAEDWGVAVPEERNAAKQLARRIAERVTVVLGPDLLEVAARRWAGQLNENAKQWALHAALPEADHNLMVGFPGPAVAREALHALLLDAAALHPRNRLRVQLTARALDEADVPHDELLIGGAEPLDTLLRACYLGDWVSLYAALLHEVDPYPVAVIDWLKQALTERR